MRTDPAHPVLEEGGHGGALGTQALGHHAGETGAECPSEASLDGGGHSARAARTAAQVFEMCFYRHHQPQRGDGWSFHSACWPLGGG
jgi:hypothetical protein